MTFMQCRLFLVSLYPQNRPIEYMYLAEPIEDVFHLKDERERESLSLKQVTNDSISPRLFVNLVGK